MARPICRFLPCEAFCELTFAGIRIEGYGSVLTATDHVGPTGATGCFGSGGGVSFSFSPRNGAPLPAPAREDGAAGAPCFFCFVARGLSHPRSGRSAGCGRPTAALSPVE